MAIEGLSAPGNYYSALIDHYFDYPSWLRLSLLYGSKFFLLLFGYTCIIPDGYHIQILDGKGVQLIYACLGVGVLSFWLAFVVANRGVFLKKLIWVIGGMIFIWLINIIRICLFLISVNKQQKMPLGLDNHTFFNALAYAAVFVMIFFYDRSFRKV